MGRGSFSNVSCSALGLSLNFCKNLFQIGKIACGEVPKTETEDGEQMANVLSLMGTVIYEVPFWECRGLIPALDYSFSM